MKLEPEEKRLDGKWELRHGHVVGDAACERIEKLIKNDLEKIAVDGSGWDTLYRDPMDGRYWECVYLHGEQQGGGPPSLIQAEDGVVEKNMDCTKLPERVLKRSSCQLGEALTGTNGKAASSLWSTDHTPRPANPVSDEGLAESVTAWLGPRASDLRQQGSF